MDSKSTPEDCYDCAELAATARAIADPDWEPPRCDRHCYREPEAVAAELRNLEGLKLLQQLGLLKLLQQREAKVDKDKEDLQTLLDRAEQNILDLRLEANVDDDKDGFTSLLNLSLERGVITREDYEFIVANTKPKP